MFEYNKVFPSHFDIFVIVIFRLENIALENVIIGLVILLIPYSFLNYIYLYIISHILYYFLRP